MLRLDDQEMELRNYSNLQKESEALSSSKNELMYRVTTVTDMLEVCTWMNMSGNNMTGFFGFFCRGALPTPQNLQLYVDKQDY